MREKLRKPGTINDFYPQDWRILRLNVRNHSSTMEHVGFPFLIHPCCTHLSACTSYMGHKIWDEQWPFQEPKLEVPTIYKAYFSGLCKGIPPQNMALYGTVPPF